MSLTGGGSEFPRSLGRILPEEPAARAELSGVSPHGVGGRILRPAAAH